MTYEQPRCFIDQDGMRLGQQFHLLRHVERRLRANGQFVNRALLKCPQFVLAGGKLAVANSRYIVDGSV